MGTNIIEFPTRAVREWIMVERTIREVLEQVGASAEMTEEVCARMKDVYERYNRMFTLALKLPLPEYLSLDQRRAIDDSIRNAVEGLTKEIHDYSSQVLFDRLCLEIELFKLRSEK